MNYNGSTEFTGKLIVDLNSKPSLIFDNIVFAEGVVPEANTIYTCKTVHQFSESKNGFHPHFLVTHIEREKADLCNKATPLSAGKKNLKGNEPERDERDELWGTLIALIIIPFCIIDLIYAFSLSLPFNKSLAALLIVVLTIFAVVRKNFTYRARFIALFILAYSFSHVANENKVNSGSYFLPEKQEIKQLGNIPQ